jgi:hypothetical protein
MGKARCQSYASAFTNVAKGFSNTQNIETRIMPMAGLEPALRFRENGF